ncbi:MAG: universal stress protein [Bacteroidota bacterium]
MKKRTKILFPTDFSHAAQNAFRHALLMADRLDADIVLLHVVYPQTEALDTPVMVAKATQTHVDAALEVMRSFVSNGMTQVLEQLSAAPGLTTTVEVGTPVQLIRNRVESEAADLVIMGAKGEQNAFGRLLGSVAAGTVANAPCPVLVIPEEVAPKAIQTVAYATAISEADPYEIWKAMRLLKTEQTIFHIVHVNTDRKSFRETEGLDQLKSFFEEQAPALQMNYHHIPGSTVEETLTTFVENHEVDLLVMYQPKRSFIERLFKRSFTKKMAGSSKVPLLVMKA